MEAVAETRQASFGVVNCPCGCSRVLQPCGTVAAYWRHIKRRERPCEPCAEAGSEYHRGRYDADPKRRREEARAWRERNPERVRETNRRNRARFYGLTLAARTALYEESDGLCALCYEQPARHVDHDHLTGKVRGALCNACNRMIGFARDDTQILARGIDYLTEPRESNEEGTPEEVYRLSPSDRRRIEHVRAKRSA